MTTDYSFNLARIRNEQFFGPQKLAVNIELNKSNGKSIGFSWGMQISSGKMLATFRGNFGNFGYFSWSKDSKACHFKIVEDVSKKL